MDSKDFIKYLGLTFLLLCVLYLLAGVM